MLISRSRDVISLSIFFFAKENYFVFPKCLALLEKKINLRIIGFHVLMAWSPYSDMTQTKKMTTV